jgi:mannose/fructose/N-acetylgalactosamine-specific phosphotransferase system component IIC
MPIEATGKVASGAIDAMKSTPLAIALLVVNVFFLAFAAYILGEVASNAKDRNTAQLELINNLVRDIRDCRQGPANSRSMLFKNALEKITP